MESLRPRFFCCLLKILSGPQTGVRTRHYDLLSASEVTLQETFPNVLCDYQMEKYRTINSAVVNQI